MMSTITDYIFTVLDMHEEAIDAIVDNVFCAAILKILEMPGILEGNCSKFKSFVQSFSYECLFVEDSPSLEDVRKHFDKNGYHSDDEEYLERKALETKRSKIVLDDMKQFDSHDYNDEDFIKRKQFASKLNKNFTKKAQKLAKAQKFNVSY